MTKITQEMLSEIRSFKAEKVQLDEDSSKKNLPKDNLKKNLAAVRDNHAKLMKQGYKYLGTEYKSNRGQISDTIQHKYLSPDAKKQLTVSYDEDEPSFNPEMQLKHSVKDIPDLHNHLKQVNESVDLHPHLDEAIALDEVSLGLKMRAVKQSAARVSPDGYGDDSDRDVDRVNNGIDRIRAKHGDVAGDHAEKAANTGMYGRPVPAGTNPFAKDSLDTKPIDKSNTRKDGKISKVETGKLKYTIAGRLGAKATGASYKSNLGYGKYDTKPHLPEGVNMDDEFEQLDESKEIEALVRKQMRAKYGPGKVKFAIDKGPGFAVHYDKDENEHRHFYNRKTGKVNPRLHSKVNWSELSSATDFSEGVEQVDELYSTTLKGLMDKGYAKGASPKERKVGMHAMRKWTSNKFNKTPEEAARDKVMSGAADSYRQKGRYMGDDVEYVESPLSESRMAELDDHLTTGLGKHIAAFKAGKMDADTLGAHVVKHQAKVAKDFGIEKKHAISFTNDFVEHHLKEDVENMDEARSLLGKNDGAYNARMVGSGLDSRVIKGDSYGAHYDPDAPEPKAAPEKRGRGRPRKDAGASSGEGSKKWNFPKVGFVSGTVPKSKIKGRKITFEDLESDEFQIIIEKNDLWSYKIVLDEEVLFEGQAVTEYAAMSMADRYLNLIEDTIEEDTFDTLSEIKKIAARK